MSRTAALLVAALAVATSALPFAAAEDVSYIYTGKTGAQTQIDYRHSSTWSILVAEGANVVLGGGKITMKVGSATTANVTLACYAGTSSAGKLLASSTLQPSAFTQKFAPITFSFGKLVDQLTAGDYFCEMTSNAQDPQSEAYFIKGYGDSIVSTDGKTPTPGTDTTTAAGLFVVKSGPATVVASNSYTYTLQLGNSGTQSKDAFNKNTVVTVKDQLPGDVTATAATAGTGVANVDCTGLNTPGALLVCSVKLSAKLDANTDAADGASFKITVTAPSVPGVITNYVAVNPKGTSNDVPDPKTCIKSYCWSTSTDVSDDAKPSLALTKSCPAVAVVNKPMTCTLTFTNVGTANLPTNTPVKLLDKLPTGTTYVDPSATPISGLSSVICDGKVDPMQCTATTNVVLVPGASASFSMQLTPTAVNPTTLNLASVSADGKKDPPQPDECTSDSRDKEKDNCALSKTNVEESAVPALTLAKSSPATAAAGSEYAYTLTFTNDGTADVPAGNVALKDLLPPGVKLVSTKAGAGLTAASCGALGATGLLACTATLEAPLKPTASASFIITVTAPSSSGVITNYASVSADGKAEPAPPPCETLACAGAPTTIVGTAQLSLQKTGPPTGLVGDKATYVLTITNKGDSAIAAGAIVSVFDQLPATATYVSAAPVPGAGITSVTCTGTSLLTCSPVLAVALAKGASASFSIVMTLPAGSSSVNYASVSADGLVPPATPGKSCDTPACASFTTTLTSPLLALDKKGPANVFGGENIVFTLNITNVGDVTAPGVLPVTLQDQLPNGFTFVSVSPVSGVSAVSCTGTSLLSCSVTLASGGLAPGKSAIFSMTVTTPPTFIEETNLASVSPDGVTPPANPSTCSGGQSRRRLLCNKCPCASHTVRDPVAPVDPVNPTDPANSTTDSKADVLKRKVAAVVSAARRAKVAKQAQSMGLLTALANKTETKLANVDPALAAKLAGVADDVRAASTLLNNATLGMFDAATNKTLTAINSVADAKFAKAGNGTVMTP